MLNIEQITEMVKLHFKVETDKIIVIEGAGKDRTQVLALIENFHDALPMFAACKKAYLAADHDENITVGFKTPKGFKSVVNVPGKHHRKKLFEKSKG